MSSLPTARRIITGHDADGNAIFTSDDVLASTDPRKNDGSPPDANMAGFVNLHRTEGIPAKIQGPIKDYHGKATSLVDSDSVTCRIVDFPPEKEDEVDMSLLMHRTISLDYGVVLKGTIQCVLDNGVEKTVNEGDVVVQSRCVRRGEAEKCTREWPKEGYDPKIHRTYPRPEKDEDDGSRDDHSSTSGRSSSHRGHSIGQLSIDDDPKVHRRHQGRLQSPPQDPAARTNQATAPAEPQKESVLRFLAWGSTPLENFQIPAVEIPRDHRLEQLTDSVLESNFSNGFGSIINAQLSFLQVLLPSSDQIEKLVEHHLSDMAWTHAVLHIPTFRKEFKQNSSGPKGLQLRNLDLRWAALLFSLLAGGMACAKERAALSWGIKKTDQAKLARQWFKAALTCLNLADYMWKHHIYSLQAICALTLSGHLMGFSNTQTTLLSAALKIAQSLGLQRLGPEETLLSTPENREKIIRVEIGRRVWYQLCIQDWFSIPFGEMYCIQKHHFTTIPPLNYNEETMEPLPESIPTVTSYVRHLQGLGRIMSDCHDAVITSTSELQKYDVVLLYETKINAWKNSLPFSLDAPASIQPFEHPIGSWTRRSLLICYAHKVMMIHRNFLGRSFTDPAFNSTRVSCISAAKSIIRETRAALESDGPLFWIDHAFMVAAGITLCLDIFHRRATDPKASEHRKLVEGSINILSRYEDSMIAMRGIRLLSSLLTEQARTVATESLDKYNRTKRMRENDVDDPANSTALPFGQLESNKRPRQKFDVPRFVESLGGSESYAHLISNTAHAGNKSASDSQLNPSFAPSQHNSTYTTNPATTPGTIDTMSDGPPVTASTFPSASSASFEQLPTQNADSSGAGYQFPALDLNYETFEQFFPPQTGISNSYLFEDLLNFDF